MLKLGLQNEPHAYNTLVELDGVIYRFLVRWNWRTGDWRVSIQDTTNDRYYATNRRISPGSVLAVLPGNATIQAFGSDPYTKEALGVTLLVYYYTQADRVNLNAARAVGFDPTFTLR